MSRLRFIVAMKCNLWFSIPDILILRALGDRSKSEQILKNQIWWPQPNPISLKDAPISFQVWVIKPAMMQCGAVSFPY
jgi:hypothetical protein